MDGLNNVNPYQSSYPEGFNSDNTNPPLIRQSHTQNFLSSVSDNVDGMFINTINYEDTRDYTGDYASFQGNPSVFHFHSGNIDTMNWQLNPQNRDQAATHANSSSEPCQTFCDPYSDVTNDNSTHHHFQRLGISTTNSSSISYFLTHEPTNSGYIFMKVEYTQLGWISAADINKILDLTQI
ncbi:7400_t:CDS:1 [Paraglomus occultum]|uniref:7400_t:CDS:1 n=1 Tax=Paraglomus occultum TaxID=144539 RepID=A0A9N9BUT0_9GLOM|nr:7400_t:CDS:1 [Paraglomus occultum]